MPLPAVQRILILDDDEVMRGLLEAMLSAQNFEVTPAQGGEDALHLLSSGISFDIVLSDLQMPGLEGPALVHSLRAAVPASTILLGMSASEPPAELRNAFDGFLLKPFGVQLLRERAAAAEARRGAAAELTSPPSGNAFADTAALDEKVFGSLLRMIPSAQLGQLFEMALKDIEKRAERMAAAAEEEDRDTVHREAHAVKGACGMIGASELQGLAASIEGNAGIDSVAIRELSVACHRLRRVLESKL